MGSTGDGSGQHRMLLMRDTRTEHGRYGTGERQPSFPSAGRAVRSLRAQGPAAREPGCPHRDGWRNAALTATRTGWCSLCSVCCRTCHCTSGVFWFSTTRQYFLQKKTTFLLIHYQKAFGFFNYYDFILNHPYFLGRHGAKPSPEHRYGIFPSTL